MGGTENVVQLYSKFLNKTHFEVLVIGLNAGGERVKLIEDLGIKVLILYGDLDKLAQLLRETDVFHWHGNGKLKPDLLKVLKANKPGLFIQTNIFGLCDLASYDIIDYDLYVSKMILIRRMMLDKDLEGNFASKRKALSNPVDADRIISLIPSDEKLKRFKQENSLQDKFIVGRIGRSDNSKFDLITLDGFATFASQMDNAMFLLVGATPTILDYAENLNITDKLIVFETTSDLEQLVLYYKTIDVFLAASKMGESFGLVIAEAMAVGIPVVTISTPYRDNAQIELVDNGITGLVVDRSAREIAAALLFLSKNNKPKEEFATSARTKVLKEYKADLVVKSFENLIYDHFKIAQVKPEQSLLVDFSLKITEEYTNRCINMWNPAYKV